MAVTKDEVKVGDFVKVTEGYGSNYKVRDARITHVARAWITVETIGKYRREIRFRLDSQYNVPDEKLYAYSPRFYTLAQWEWYEAEAAATRYLREQGIDVGHASPWHKRKVELAELIKKGEREHAAHHEQA